MFECDHHPTPPLDMHVQIFQVNYKDNISFNLLEFTPGVFDETQGPAVCVQLIVLLSLPKNIKI